MSSRQRGDIKTALFDATLLFSFSSRNYRSDSFCCEGGGFIMQISLPPEVSHHINVIKRLLYDFRD